MNTTKGKRKTKSPCQGCFLHMERCICSQLNKFNNSVHVDLLIHHKELKRTSNSGRLIEACLENQKMWVRGLRNQPLDHTLVLKPDHQSLLLYPSEDALVLDRNWFEAHKDEKPFQLLVPDGNWRQASKVHYRVKEFKNIPRVTLASHLSDKCHLLRCETKDNGMSTLEAIGHALGVLDKPGCKEHLLKAYKLKKEAVLRARGRSF